MASFRRMLVVLVAGLLLSGLGAVWVHATAPGRAAAGTGDNPVGLPHATPTTTTTTTTAAAPTTVSQPVNVPADPYAAEPIVHIGSIRIPKIGLVSDAYEGITLRNIDLGPSHWPGTALPGQNGNAVFAGHRVTHSHPFRRINELVPGDEIIFKMQNGTFTYKMTAFQIVTPKDVHIVNQTSDATVTLFACHPPGSARQRYVVRGAFVSAAPV